MPNVSANAKRPVNLTLSPDLVRQARMVTANLSETVEALLTAHVAAEAARRDKLPQGGAAAGGDEAVQAAPSGFSEAQAPLKPASAKAQAGYNWMRTRRDARPAAAITSVELLDLLHEAG